jgi:hypothetical protein
VPPTPRDSGASSLTVNTSTKNNAQRFPSPIPTEPEDPDPEYIFEQLAKHKIKTRDFAIYSHYTTGNAPATHPSSTIVPAPQHLHNTSPLSTAPLATQPTIPLTPETFDPYKALGEFEYRLRQNPRTLPIPGKTLRRLIEIGWVTENEVESRCSQEDLNELEEFDSRNRARLLRLSALREQRQKEFGVPASAAGVPGGVTVANETEKPGTGREENNGFTVTGAYPYLTLRFDTVPTFSERDELVMGVRPLFVTVDRVIRMAMAMEREKERDRQEAEAALERRRIAEEEKERLERERVEREVLENDEEMQDASGDDTVGGGVIRIPPMLQPPAEIMSGPTTTATSRKRSPQQAWADDDDNAADNDLDELEVKRLRLARSQSETWYQQQAREAQMQSVESSQSPCQQQSQLPGSPPQSRSPRKVIVPSPASHSCSQPQSQSQYQSQQSQHSHSRSQSQSQPFIPPEIQYPAPLSAYDPKLYPDAASAIESQSQQSQGRHPYSQYSNHGITGGDTPPASPTDDNNAGGGEEGEGKGKGKEKKSGVVGRGIGLNEDGEPDDTRPNALKRSPKKGVKRGLTRGRTLVQIC